MSMAINLHHVSGITATNPHPLYLGDGKPLWVRHVEIAYGGQSVEIVLFGPTQESLAFPDQAGVDVAVVPA